MREEWSGGAAGARRGSLRREPVVRRAPPGEEVFCRGGRAVYGRRVWTVLRCHGTHSGIARQ